MFSSSPPVSLTPRISPQISEKNLKMLLSGSGLKHIMKNIRSSKSRDAVSFSKTEVKKCKDLIRLVNDQELHVHRGDEVRQRSEHSPPLHHHQLFLHHQGELRGNYAHRRQVKTTFFQGFRIHVFLGLPDPDPVVRGMDPDPSTVSLSKYS